MSEEPVPPAGPQAPLILVLDDDNAMRMALTAILQRAGFRIVSAGTGAAALDAMAKQASDIALLIVDLKLPDMFGREFVHHAVTQFGERPVLYLSGVDHEGRTDALQHRANFLGKPFDTAELIKRVRSMLPHRPTKDGR
jgi:two-component system KDP operon response regulator KdpE